jgi:hypothetical protein
MAFKFSKTLSSAAATGLVLGAMTACGGSAPPSESADDAALAAEAPAEAAADAPASPDAEAPAGDGAAGPVAAPEKACCKGQNECKAKGGCKTADNGCKSQNACKGKGGCNMHCPK